jgi:hypothetical protein
MHTTIKKETLLTNARPKYKHKTQTVQVIVFELRLGRIL